MAVFYDLDLLPRFTNAVLTVGTFDGVHLGHQLILKELKAQAKKHEGESILITFNPHPRQLLYPEQKLGIITPLDEKVQLLQQTGVDHIVVVPFTQVFASLSANEYVEQFLLKSFAPKCIVIGYDHKFGNDRKGDIHLLKRYADRSDFELFEISARLIDEAAISSTRIRNALKEGRVGEAGAMLGRRYAFSGEVVHGKKLGRTIGYPTANLLPVHGDQIIPGNGIYAVTAVLNGRELAGMMSIGYNPTVSKDRTIKIEVNIFDFNEDIYSKELLVMFHEKTRDEQKYNNLEELTAQLAVDELTVRNILALQNTKNSHAY